MAVKIWNFLASILYSRCPANIPGTLKVKMMKVLYFFVIYRLYLNCNAKLIAELQVINYRHKILQQFQHRLFVWKASFIEKERTILKKNLVFRACLLVEFFLLKLNTVDHDRPCVLNLIISAKTWRKNLTDELILRNIAGCY